MIVKINESAIRKELYKKGLYITGFSNVLGISVNYTNLIINNRRSPSPKLAKKMADVLEVEVSDIFIFENKEVNDHATTTK